MATEAPAFDISNWSLVKIGPTWQTDESGRYIMPEHTLGWEIAHWCAENLVNDDGEPWRFTNEQFRFLCWFYSVDKDGRWAYTDGYLQRLKGWGKGPFAAVLCLVELVGPCRFSHWHPLTGRPVATDNPSAVVQVAAVTQDQAKQTTELLPVYMTKAFQQKYDIDYGQERTRAMGGSRKLEVLSSSPRSQEGARPTFIVMDETHHWISSNGGHKLYAVITRNRAKSKGGRSRSLQTTNAFLPGEDSIAEKTRYAYDKTVTINPKTGRPVSSFNKRLFDSLEAPSDAPLDPAIIPRILEKVRGDAIWLDIPTILAWIMDPVNSQADARRFFYNQNHSDEETLLPPKVWDPRARDGKEGREKWELKRGDEVVLGFDGARTHDATALVAIRIHDQFVVPLGIWYDGWDGAPKISGTKDEEGRFRKWEVDFELVDEAVRFAFREYKVRAFFSDYHPWQSYVDAWSNRYRETVVVKAEPDHAVRYNMGTPSHQEDIVHANERLMAAFIDGTFFHDGNLVMRRHVMCTRRKETQWGYGFTKDSRESDNHNDAWAATVLAFLAMTKYLEMGKKPKEHDGRVFMSGQSQAALTPPKHTPSRLSRVYRY